jgi:hypothetical protein
MFAVFFTVIFFCALARIELLIDILPDIEKKKDAFLTHKIVWGTIAANETLHCLVAWLVLYINNGE